MGGNQSYKFDEDLFHQQWERKSSSFDGKTVWTNKLQPARQIEEYPIFAQNEDDINLERQLFGLRKDSNELVAATHLKESVQSGLCSSSASGRLFLQKIALRLQALEHVPFPDILHLYFNSLSGYKKLSEAVGYFKPQTEQIGFNNNGEAKVWLSSEFSSCRPQSKQASEGSMVRTLMHLIEDVTDNSTTPRQSPSIVNYTYRNKNEVKFDEALTAVKEYANQFNGGVIPKNLKCIQRIGVDRISQTLIQQNQFTPSNLSSQRSGIISGTMAAQQPLIINHGQFEQRNPVVLSTNTTFQQGSFGRTVQPPRTSSVQFGQPFSQINVGQSLGQPVTQIPFNQPIGQIPVSQPVQVVQNSTLGASGIRGSRVNFVPQVQIGQPVVQGSHVQIGQPVVQGGHFQTVRPSTLFVKQPEAQRVIQQVVRTPQGQVQVFPQNQTSQQQVFQPVAQGLVFRQPEISKCQPFLPPTVIQGPTHFASFNGNQSAFNVSANPSQPVPNANQQSQASVKNVPQISNCPRIKPPATYNHTETVYSNEPQPKSQSQIQSFLESQKILAKQANNPNFIESQEYSQLKNLSSSTEVNASQFFTKNKNFLDKNTMNVEIDNGTSQTYQSYNSSADKFGLNFDASSSRYKDVNLDDGKSSQALLAELKGFSSRKQISYGSNNFDFNPTSYYNKTRQLTAQFSTQTPLYTKDYQTSSLSNQNGIYGTFNKYSKGESLEDNLQMKYSRTKNLYEQPASSNYQYEEVGEGFVSHEYENNYELGQGEQFEYNQYGQNQEFSHEIDSLQQEGEYHVEYDPEILADIQKLKG